MYEKKSGGTTILTRVHHRETPARIREKSVNAGLVWFTEAVHAQESGLDFEVVEPGSELDQRDRISYYICRLKKGAHPENGDRFLHFIRSVTAKKIYEQYGFIPGF